MAIRPGKHYPGTTLTITGYFSEGQCDPVDPDISVEFKVHSPVGCQKTYTFGTDAEIQKVGVGHYTCDVVPDAPGRWVFQWVINDDQARSVVEQGDFLVQDTPLYDGYGRRY